MAIDRRTFGLSMLFAGIMLCAVLAAAWMPAPVYGPVSMLLAGALAAAGSLAAAGLVWSWRNRPYAALRRARRELMDAVELAAVMIVDDAGVIRHWSRGCEELYGWTAAEAVGRRRGELLHTRLPVPDAEIWRRLHGEGRCEVEYTERHRDGRELVVHDHIKLFDHRDGTYSAVIALTDVTAWRRTEAALRLSEARLATAVAVQGIFIYEYDLITDRPIWTTRGEAFFGMDAADDDPEPAGSRWAWEAEHSAQIRGVFETAVAEGRDRAHFDFDFRYPDGSDRRAEGWARIIHDAEGRPARLLGTHLDVTERRARERALLAGEAEKRAMLATIPDAMLVCNERGVIRSCSATAEELFGYRAQHLVGLSLIDLVEAGSSRTAIRRELTRSARRAPDVPWPMPINICRSDGLVVPVSFVVGEAMVDGAQMYVVFGRDMRPTIATEEKYYRLRNDLAQVSRLGMMGEMAGALAHELSQPLSAIVNFLGAVDLMLDSGEAADAEKLRHAVHCASEQSARAGEIIRRLRAFILRGEADMRAEPLAALVREAAALALFNTGSFGVRLSYDFEDEARLVLGDRVQIQQVLVNLIRNGADAMTAHGGERRDMIISTAMLGDALVEISVRDSGPGIAPEMLEKLFSPFATTKREGLGFGLAISRRIVEAHGGQLSAGSAPDGGAIFRFTLPVMEEESRA